jgi:hypothetical protein
VGYISDDSHAYRRWNAGPPFNPDTWGIAVWGTGESFDRADVSLYDIQEDPDILVRIVRVGNRERIRKPFTLEKEERVRVYALGEMDDDDEYDYGWIEDERGRKIWQMQFDDTEHAGGASKNRKINKIIRLEPGAYTVYYRSDGSHSYNDWNSTPPHDAEYWGIMLRRER